MDISFLSYINYAAIITSIIIFFFLGSLWFSVLFADAWTTELSKHSITIKEPTKSTLMWYMILTILNHTVIVLSLAYLVYMTRSVTFLSGLALGCVTAFGLAAPAVAGIFIWESRSLRLFMIDMGYQVIGIIMSSIILSLWQ